MKTRHIILALVGLLGASLAHAQVPRATSTQQITDRLKFDAIADPASPVNGDLWRSSTTANTFKYRSAGTTYTLATTADLTGVYQPLDAALTALAAGSDYVQFSGPTTSTKIFALPDASATILTSNAAVTATQGGTGQTSYTTGDLLYASSSSALSKLAAVASGQVLVSAGTGTAPAWSATPTLTYLGLGTTPQADSTFSLGGTAPASSGISRGILMAVTYASASSGTLAVGQNNFATLSGSSTVTQVTLFRGAGINTGTATATTFTYFDAVASITGTATNAYAFRGQLSAGSGRLNLNMDGTAANLLAGVTTISNTTDSSSTTTGALITSGGLGVAKNITGGGTLNTTYAPAAFAAGSTVLNQIAVSGAGDSGGTSAPRGTVLQLTLGGPNNFAAAYASRTNLIVGGSAGTVAAGIGHLYAFISNSAMSATNITLLNTSVQFSGTGNVTDFTHFSVGGYDVWSSTGKITGTSRGLAVGNMSVATQGTVAIGVDISDQTKGSGDVYGIRSQIAAASGKWSGYFSGTADFYVAGKTGIGIAATSTAQLSLAAGTTGVASLNIPHGSAPSSPVNGDMWTTTAGLFVRINGATVGPL